MPRLLHLAVFLAAIACVLVALSTACGSAGTRLITDLHLSGSTVNPSGASSVPITVSYALTRPATMSAYVTRQSGDKFYLRQNETRPVAGEYTLSFNGAYAPDPKGDERRILSAGDYQLVIEARDGSASDQASAQVRVVNPDTALPGIDNLTVFPDVLSHNGDGIDDVVGITYRTTKLSTVSLYLASQDGKRYVLERQVAEPAGEHSTTWDGQIGNNLVPSGKYQLVVESQDTSGNVTLAQKPLNIDASSNPDAHILSVSFDPTSVMFGDKIKVTIRVKNTGNTILKSQGPDPGYVYDSQEGFSTIQGGAFRDQKGLWRVGVDWAGAPGASGAKYPYRWGLGKDLQPGEEATVVGYIRIDHKYPQVWLYAGLIQEQVRYWDNVVGTTVVQIGY